MINEMCTLNDTPSLILFSKKRRPFARGFATRGKRVRRASVAWQKRFPTSVTAAKEVGY